MKTSFRFKAFLDYEDGRLARVETTGDFEVPMNISCEENTDLSLAEGDLCEAEVMGAGSNIVLYRDEEAFEKANPLFAMPSVIPAGVFPPDNNTDSFQQEPVILFSGTVRNVIKNPDPQPDEPNYFLEVETLEMDLSLYILYDGDIEKGSIISGEAWIFGDIKKQ